MTVTTDCGCGEVALDSDTITVETPEGQIETSGTAEWEGPIGLEGIPTGDGRLIELNALRWDTLPVPLRWAREDHGEHKGAVVVGKIAKIWRNKDGQIWGRGTFDLGSPEGREAHRQCKEGLTPGISMDLDDIVVRQDDPEDPEAFTIVEGRIRAATQVAIPAFEGARISVAEPVAFRDYSPETREKQAEEGLAMPDGSFPIANCEDLKNAIQSIGRAKDPAAAKAHIKERKGVLGCDEVSLPTSFNVLTRRRVALAALTAALSPIDSKGSIEISEALFDEAIRTGLAYEVGVRSDGAVLYDLSPTFNWVDDVGGLPPYIKRIQKHLEKKGMDESHAIATAVNVVKKMCATGDLNFPGAQQVNAGSRAEACAAVADWEAKKVRAKASSGDSLVASAQVFDADWFENPNLKGPTPLTVTDDGRVFGHIALWGTCHIASPQGAGVCTQPPRSKSNYSFFKTGAVKTTKGDLAVGKITMSTVHAGARLSSVDTLHHYEHTGTVGAFVNAGEDTWGIWVAGGAHPSADHTSLKGAPVSGDWRQIGGSLEMVGALSVNVPGFPVPRPEALVAGGTVMSLVASGMVTKETTLTPGQRFRAHRRARKAALLAARVDKAAKFARVRRLHFAYNPDQWRVPKGNGERSGRFIDMPDNLLKSLEVDMQDAFESADVDENLAADIGQTLDRALESAERASEALRGGDGDAAKAAASEVDEHLSKLEAQLQEVAEVAEPATAENLGESLAKAREGVDVINDSDLSLMGDEGIGGDAPESDIGGDEEGVVGDTPEAPAGGGGAAPAGLKDVTDSPGMGDAMGGASKVYEDEDTGFLVAQREADGQWEVFDDSGESNGEIYGSAEEAKAAIDEAMGGGDEPEAPASDSSDDTSSGGGSLAAEGDSVDVNDAWEAMKDMPAGSVVQSDDGEFITTYTKNDDGSWAVSSTLDDIDGETIPADPSPEDRSMLDGGGQYEPGEVSVVVKSVGDEGGNPTEENDETPDYSLPEPTVPGWTKKVESPGEEDEFEYYERDDGSYLAEASGGGGGFYLADKDGQPIGDGKVYRDPEEAMKAHAPEGSAEASGGGGSAQQQAATKVDEAASSLEANLMDAADSGALDEADAEMVGEGLGSLRDSIDTLKSGIDDGAYNEADLAAVQQQLSNFEAQLMAVADKPGLSDDQAAQIGQALDDLFAEVGTLAASLQGSMEPPPFARRRYVRQWLGRRGIRLGKSSLIV